jgi:hypothetical protein
MTAVAAVKFWWKRNAGGLAVVLAFLAVALLVVVVAQAGMLHDQDWIFAMGTVPGWYSAFFAGIAAVGMVAAFANLRIVRKGWESQQAERRDQLANQARLIIVEPAAAPEQRPGKYVLVRNHSDKPVLNLRPEHLTLRDKYTNFREVDPSGGNETVPPRTAPVLAPAEATSRVGLGTWMPSLSDN